MPDFQFNLTMIATANELGEREGFRVAADAMKIVFDILGIEMKVPPLDATEQWLQRIGVDAHRGHPQTACWTLSKE